MGMETQVIAFARRDFWKPCKKFYDDNKGLEVHERGRHSRPPSPNNKRYQDNEREA
jgi:hypothetical protein